MLRESLDEGLKAAMRARNERAVSTLRLILAALKDRDIAERGKGNPAGLTDEQILGLLRSMIKQRNESIRLYEQGGRVDLAKQEAEEIEIIDRFLPPQMDEAHTEAAIAAAIAEIDAKSLKDMGRVMALLKERFSGQMDFAKASALVKRGLG
ncbi:MAG: GatB/YqeY domain-containing protein [Rhodospirillales bacterium]|nr:GatB/YqeY domain-containing protein [Rhodospirillales bacterium]